MEQEVWSQILQFCKEPDSFVLQQEEETLFKVIWTAHPLWRMAPWGGVGNLG